MSRRTHDPISVVSRLPSVQFAMVLLYFQRSKESTESRGHDKSRRGTLAASLLLIVFVFLVLFIFPWPAIGGGENAKKTVAKYRGGYSTLSGHFFPRGSQPAEGGRSAGGGHLEGAGSPVRSDILNELKVVSRKSSGPSATNTLGHVVSLMQRPFGATYS